MMMAIHYHGGITVIIIDACNFSTFNRGIFNSIYHQPTKKLNTVASVSGNKTSLKFGEMNF
jgi:hypothetical protein